MVLPSGTKQRIPWLGGMQDSRIQLLGLFGMGAGVQGARPQAPVEVGGRIDHILPRSVMYGRKSVLLIGSPS